MPHVKTIFSSSLTQKFKASLALGLSSVFFLSACGGGGSAPPANQAPTVFLSLSGTAAVGAAFVDANIKIKCLNAVGDTKTASDGSYVVKIAGASLPCALRATANDGRKLHSIIVGTSEEAVANITPLTELLLARAARKDAASFFEGFNAEQVKKELTAQQIQEAMAEIKAFLTGVVDLSELSDFISSKLSATSATNLTGNAYDKLLDMLKERVDAAMFGEFISFLASGKPIPDHTKFKPTLETNVTKISLETNQSYQFSATINYPSNIRYKRQPVTWIVPGADGGSIEAYSGVYKAPDKPGSFQIIAKRDDFPSMAVTIHVTVTEKGGFIPNIRLLLNGRTEAIHLRRGQMTDFAADVNYPPNVNYLRPPISWSVLESDGGKIDSVSGHYIAPQKLGVYHIKASRDDFPSVSVSAVVAVGHFEELPYGMPGAFAGGTSPEQGNYVARDAAAFKVLKENLHLEAWTKEMPVIDFSKDMIIVIYPKEPSSGCTRIEVNVLRYETSEIILEFGLKEPPADVLCMASVTGLVKVIAADASALPIRFVRKN